MRLDLRSRAQSIYCCWILFLKSKYEFLFSLVPLILFIILYLKDVKTSFTYNTHLWIVSGCLKLLPPEELEHLGLPEGEESTSPVKKVLYISENDTPFLEENTALSQQRTGATRFIFFTGNQTFDQREKSFKVMSCILLYLMGARTIDAYCRVKAELKFRSLLNFL